MACSDNQTQSPICEVTVDHNLDRDDGMAKISFGLQVLEKLRQCFCSFLAIPAQRYACYDTQKVTVSNGGSITIPSNAFDFSNPSYSDIKIILYWNGIRVNPLNLTHITFTRVGQNIILGGMDFEDCFFSLDIHYKETISLSCTAPSAPVSSNCGCNNNCNGCNNNCGGCH